MSDVVTMEKRPVADDIKTQVMAVAVKATEAERKAVSDLQAKAKGAKYGAEVVGITPAMAALIFLEANPANRDWQPTKTQEWARRMRDGLWRQNNQAPGFYTTGQLEDGQHRLAACALADYTWETLVVFGIETSAISTVDAGARRTGADAAKLEGVHDARFKEAILRASASYLVKRGDKTAALKSETEMARAIKAKDVQLSLAAEMAKASELNLVKPVLKPTVAAAAAFLMLEHGWPEQRVREKLALLNSGQSTEGDNDPFFIAGSMITKSRERADGREKLSTVKELGLIILVMGKSELGPRVAVEKRRLQAELNKGLPDPTYRAPMQEAA
jgi:hypothetical protein